MIDKKQYFAFSLVKGLGPINFQKLYSYFPSIVHAWQAPYSELVRSGLQEKVVMEIIETRNKVNIEEELEKIYSQNIDVVTLNDNNYPKLLKQISNPPFLLYYKGKLNDPRDVNSVAVVGTRKISEYGKRVTQNIVTELVKYNLSIVSGLASGIDAVAHQTCLDNNGRTIAVLGFGLNSNVFYPKENIQLAQDILNNNGLILSEYPPHTRPERYFFPQRNRIVAGLSLGTLVTEAPKRSGALLTAKLALDYNREVFTIPGDINSVNSQGPHDLIQTGAKLVTTADDIITEIPLELDSM